MLGLNNPLSFQDLSLECETCRKNNVAKITHAILRNYASIMRDRSRSGDIDNHQTTYIGDGVDVFVAGGGG